MQLLTIENLILRGTHNSYSCQKKHLLNEQIDDFGVWAVEIDFSVSEDGIAKVGHDRAGDDACGGLLLTEFLQMVRNTQAINYRPVFIYFEIKEDWGVGDLKSRWRAGIEAVKKVFQENYMILDDYVRLNNGRYPTIPEIAGKVVIYYPNPEFEHRDPPFHGTLRGKEFGEDTSLETIERNIQPPENYRVFRLDEYTADWTFTFGVPPNPLIVDWTVQPIREHGTRRFPYKMVGKAVQRAEGKIRPNDVPDQRRSGYGWTVLIRPGNYREAITINIPLTLKKDARFTGTVVIGH